MIKLPTYAEELRRHVELARNTADAAARTDAALWLTSFLIDNLDRILRDAEIAEACRAYVRAIDAGDGQEMSHAEVEMFDLIAKWMSVPVNQCDGCRRGLVLDRDIHRDASGRAIMGCTAHLYAARAYLDTQQTRQQHVADDERLDVFEDYSGPDTKDPS